MTADDPQTRGPRPVDPAEDLLAAYRESQALPEGVKARVRQRLLLAGASPSEAEAAAPPVEARRRRAAIDPRWWIAVAAILLLAFAALVLLSEQSSGIVASRRGLDGAAYTAEEASRPRSAVGRGAPGARPASTTPTPTTTPSSAAATTATTPSSATTPGERVPLGPPGPDGDVPGGSKRTTAAGGERESGAGNASSAMSTQGTSSPQDSARAAPQDAPPTLDLAAEKALLENAWRALSAGDDPGARAALRRHRRDFAAGILSQERETLEVLLACTTDAPGAAQRAARFRREHPESPWKARLDAVCPDSPGPLDPTP